MKKKVFCFKLGRAYLFDVIVSDDIEGFIANNIVSSKDEAYNNVESVITFINHKCNDRCMVKTSTGELRFSMPNYFLDDKW